jgi:hypothetical protein
VLLGTEKKFFARSEVNTAVLIKIQVFRDVTPRRLVNSFVAEKRGSILKMEATRFSETSVTIYMWTQHNIPEELTL